MILSLDILIFSTACVYSMRHCVCSNQISMGVGRGKGGDQSGAIAAGCCGICCMVCFFLVGVPMLITGIVFVRIHAGDYDDQVQEE